MNNPTVSLTDITRQTWRSQANCIGRAELFVISDKHSRNATGLDADELHELNRSNFEKAEEVCLECPVFVQCGESIPMNDPIRQWTFVAGEPPNTQTDYNQPRLILRARNVITRSATPPLEHGEPRLCKRGHASTVGDRCLFCMGNNKAESTAPEELARHCVNGHEVFSIKNCVRCESDRKRRALEARDNQEESFRTCIRGHQTRAHSSCGECSSEGKRRRRAEARLTREKGIMGSKGAE